MVQNSNQREDSIHLDDLVDKHKAKVLFGYYLLTFRPLVPKHPKIIRLQFLRQYFLNVVLHTTNYMFTNMYLLIANMKKKTNELSTTIKNQFLIDNFL